MRLPNAVGSVASSFLCSILVLLFVFAPAKSATVPDRFLEAPYGATAAEVDDALKSCEKNQITSNLCAWYRYIQAEKDFKMSAAALGQAFSAYKEAQGKLEQSNRAFVAFRNTTCDFDGSGGGSMAFGEIYNCRLVYTRRRARAMRAYADCMKAQDCRTSLYSFEIPNP
ncbi:MAG TPA: lysozyme inhibitor LprI family protein [Rhizomicrobium sp.]|nr:lysozyme inhibitor LprI family protein [Rhizomicrobium sp.]